MIRFSYGRYTQPTQTSSEQVLTYEDGFQMASNLYGSSYYNNGFSSITHNNPIQFSNNWDASLEQHLNGTDWSYKISPYYRYTSNQSVEVALPGGLSGSFNSGTQKTEGLEVAIQKGDPSRNGFSGQLSYTYTYSQIKYSLINGNNIVSTELSNLQNFYGLTKNGGGSPCYAPGNIPEANCQKNDKANGIPARRSLPTPTTICFPTSSRLPACRRSFRSTDGIRRTPTSSHSAYKRATRARRSRRISLPGTSPGSTTNCRPPSREPLGRHAIRRADGYPGAGSTLVLEQSGRQWCRSRLEAGRLPDVRSSSGDSESVYRAV